MPSPRSTPPERPDVSTAVGDYLKRIYFLQSGHREGAAVSTGDLARSMGVSPPSATAMIRRLARENLVEYERYRGVRLTAAGFRSAVSITRKHRLVETLLHEVLKLDWSEVHVEAERLEHAISDRLLQRIDEFLGRPAADPHGDPIPEEDGSLRQQEAVPLSRCPASSRVEIVRVTRQDPAFLRFLAERGLRPGRRLTVASSDSDSGVLSFAVDEENEIRTLSLQVAQSLQVEVVSEPDRSSGD